MSKEKTLRTLEETEVMQTAGIPAQKTEGAGVVMATEIIADLKKQLEEAKEEAKDWEENWNVCRKQAIVLSRQSDTVPMVVAQRNVRRMNSGSVRKLRQVCIIPTKI